MPSYDPSRSKYRYQKKKSTTKSASVKSNDMFDEDLSDILPLPHEREKTMTPNKSSISLEWECAAAAFKQLAFNYGVMLGKTPQDCERDLRKALDSVAKRQPRFVETEFYKEGTK